MSSLDIEEWGAPQTMILYATHDSWRYAIYTRSASLEGELSSYVTPDLAQREASQILDRVFARSLTLEWDVLDPGWWVAHVTESSS